MKYDDLDGLPNGAIVVGRDAAWMKQGTVWTRTGSSRIYTTEYLLLTEITQIHPPKEHKA